MARVQDLREFHLSEMQTYDSVHSALHERGFQRISRPLVIVPPERYPGQWAVSFDTSHSSPGVIVEMVNEALRRHGFGVVGMPQISMECETLPMRRVIPRHPAPR